jgi:acyl-CoA synthetase (NDP forming)
MNTITETNRQIESIFHPRSIAIVGLPRGMRTGKLFLMALQDQKFPGPIYPVNPNADEIDGLKSYPDLASIPGPVDLAIVLVPSRQTLPVVEACVKKGVKGAVLFTAGYVETGTQEGRRLQDDIVHVARSGGMRLIGPNGMGLYAPVSGLSFFPELSRQAGKVGLISHSGSLANILGRMASEKGVYFSKAVSIGNECDLTCADFLNYLAKDPSTELIGAYVEGIRNGGALLSAIRNASLVKPVVLWKVGLTAEGARASASHTGALASSAKIWSAVVKQSGALPVAGFEKWLDALMAFSLIPENCGRRVAVISGPGGLAVSAAEACGSAGLSMASLNAESKSMLASLLPPTGTSIKNPIDVGLSASLDIDIYLQAARTAARDPGVDAVFVIGIGLSPDSNEQFTAGMIAAQKDFQKPFIMVRIPGFDKGLAVRFCNAGLPFFNSAERAMNAYAMVLHYYNWRRRAGEALESE